MPSRESMTSGIIIRRSGVQIPPPLPKFSKIRRSFSSLSQPHALRLCDDLRNAACNFLRRDRRHRVVDDHRLETRHADGLAGQFGFVFEFGGDDDGGGHALALERDAVIITTEFEYETELTR